MTTAAERYNKRLYEILSPERIEEATRPPINIWKPELYGKLCAAQLIAKNIADGCQGSAVSDAHRQAAYQINCIIDRLYPNTVDQEPTNDQ